MPAINPFEMEPYRLEWRADLVTHWVIVERMSEHPGDLAKFVKDRLGDEAWAANGQWRVVSQHVIEAAGLGAEVFAS